MRADMIPSGLGRNQRLTAHAGGPVCGAMTAYAPGVTLVLLSTLFTYLKTPSHNYVRQALSPPTAAYEQSNTEQAFYASSFFPGYVSSNSLSLISSMNIA